MKKILNIKKGLMTTMQTRMFSGQLPIGLRRLWRFRCHACVGLALRSIYVILLFGTVLDNVTLISTRLCGFITLFLGL
jgi:hypothetical protein